MSACEELGELKAQSSVSFLSPYSWREEGGGVFLSTHHHFLRLDCYDAFPPLNYSWSFDNLVLLPFNFWEVIYEKREWAKSKFLKVSRV